MQRIPKTENTPLVRTDFSDDAAWKAVCAAVEQAVGEFEFRAYVSPVSDPMFDDATNAQIVAAASEIEHLFVLVADRRALREPEHPVLVIDLNHEPGRSFRVIPSHAWSVENNLSLANVDWEDFEAAVDEHGVFRGFPE